VTISISTARFAFNFGAYVNQNLDSISVFSKAYVVEKAMQRVIELKPSFYRGGAHLFLIVYYGARSPMMGGNPDKAKRHYELLKSLTHGELLIADLFYARYYLYQKQDPDRFKSMLNHVITAEAGNADFALFNAVAVKKAKFYLNHLDFFFD